MRVLLKKSTEDMNWGGDDYDVITAQSHKQGFDPIAICLSGRLSPLKAMLLKRLGTVKRMYLHLRVDCEKDSFRCEVHLLKMCPVRRCGTNV